MRRAVVAHAARVHRRARERRHAVAAVREGERTRTRHENRTTIECGRHGRHEHRLFRIGRTAEAAITQVPATFDVAPDRRDRNAEFRRAARERLVVRVRRDFPRRDREPCFHSLEPRREIGRREAFEAVRALPARERRGRRAERARPVDRRSAADAATLQDADRLVLRLAGGGFLVERRIRFGLAHPEVGGRRERPFLHEDDREARLRSGSPRRCRRRRPCRR